MITKGGPIGLLMVLCAALPAGASAEPMLDASCPGPRDGTQTGPPPSRIAQTFTAQTTGALTGAQFEGSRSPGPAGGDYLLAINEVDASGVPTNTTLASATVPTSALPAPDFTASVTYAAPAHVTSGQTYALVLSRDPGNLTVARRTGNVCPGGLFGSATATDPFTSSGASSDAVFAVFVEPADLSPPDTAITSGPKSKTKKKAATFAFSGVDARVIAGFECSLDGGAYTTCTSPFTVKVKKGKHTFSVRATDVAGNVDGTPATFAWKVKKKKRR